MDNVVVTGYGVKVPGASNSNEFNHMLKYGVCTHRILEGLGPNQSNIVAGYMDEDFIEIRGINYKRYTRASRMAMAASDEAFKMADLACIEPKRIGIIMGTSVGGLLEMELYSKRSEDYQKFPLHGVPMADPQTLSSAIANHLGITGLNLTITTGCTASSDAIMLGKTLLETNQLDVCIVGGSDAPLGKWSTYGFMKIKTIEKNKQIYETGVPFSTTQNGFVMAEGAGILVLERESFAKQRGVTIKGKINKIYSNNEATPIFKADTTGSSMIKAIQETVKDEIPTYVNSQALGLHTNDRIEYIAHKEVFMNDIPITSIKGMTGHVFGTMGAIQTISSLLSIKNSYIPPTIKSTGTGYEDLPIVFDTEERSVDSVLVTTHSNGGNNTVILITKN